MYRRSLCVLCRSYRVPPLARVGVFPIHLDPPTQQHREIFKLLLGHPTRPSPPLGLHGNGRLAPFALSATGGGHDNAPAGAGAGAADGPHHPHPPLSTGAGWDRGRLPSTYWYLETFAEALARDSQLAPLDHLILLPNTRYPISLRQSTHLAALSVLAARGIPRLHVDFTALEHPDDSMPVVHELTQQYRNSVLVHWLHDAYEMLNWRNFAEMKVRVPILLLQTSSLPVGEALTQPPPSFARAAEDAGSVVAASADASSSGAGSSGSSSNSNTPTHGHGSLLHSRLYQDPSRVTDAHLADFYDRAARHMAAQLRYRAQQSHPAVLQEQERQQQQQRRSTAPTPTPTPAPAESGSGVGVTASATDNAEAVATAVNDVDQLVRGEWWLTRGGRGDDRVEVSRSYSNAASSLWLGCPASLGKKRVLLDTLLGSGHEGAAATRAGGVRQGRAGSDHVERPAECEADSPDDLGGDHEDVGVEDDDDGGTGAVEEGEVSEAASHRHAGRDYVVTDDGVLAVRGGSSSRTVPPSAAAPTVGEGRGDARSTVSAAAGGPPPAPPVLVGMGEAVPTEGAVSAPAPVGHSKTSTMGDLRGVAATAREGRTRDAPKHREQSPGSPSRPPRRARGGRSARDPNSVVSRRSVRALIEELFPSLSFAHAQLTQAPWRQTPAVGEAAAQGVVSGSAGDPTSSPTPASALPVPPPSSIGRVVGATVAVAGRGSDGRVMGGGAGGATRLAARSAGAASLAGRLPAVTASVTAAAPPPLHTSSTAAAMPPSGPHPHPLPPPMVEVHPVMRTTGADVRQALWEQDVPLSALLTDAVARYVENHGLYRDSRKSAEGAAGHALSSTAPVVPVPGAAAGSGLGAPPYAGGAASPSYGVLRKMLMTQKEAAVMSFPGFIPRLELHYDKNNLLAREQYEKLKVFQCLDGETPDLIVPIGGDGYMMHCIRNNWRRFIPFYGVNAGHVGYLLNDCATLEELFSSPLKLHSMNMLYCQAEKETDTGERVLLSELAFNDAWVERSSGQTALIRILVNGEERIRRLRGDGVLVSTAAGSTAYSQALGASPVPVGAPLIQVVGSNVVSPAQWRPVHLDQEDQVEFEVIDSIKRPCRCYVDSVDVGNITRMLVRSSRVAAVTLAFSRSCDLQHKLYQMQFPKTL